MAVDASIFDSIARILARVFSRRALLTALGGFPLVRLPHTLGAQLSPATCGASGDVCTRIAGCCSGLTCVTSAINVNYGVCIAGGGGTVSVGTSLISPFSEGVELEIAALLNSAALTETTSTSSATESTTTKKERRDVRIAENKAIQDARKAEAQLRKDQQKLESKTRRRSRNGNQASTAGSTLQARITCPQTGVRQTIAVINRSASSVTVAQISSLLNPIDEEPFTPNVLVGAGITLEFFVGVPNVDDPLYLGDTPIFEASPLEGVRVTLASGVVLHACCDGTTTCLGQAPVSSRKRRSRRGRKGGASN
ncbi:MAG: hypothetical protein M3Q50_09800 [Chloroflexota bacterium]|nr:hypothetical protein [Chloroflexota bacterium]